MLPTFEIDVSAENNAGSNHATFVKVKRFGPNPLSRSESDLATETGKEVSRSSLTHSPSKSDGSSRLPWHCTELQGCRIGAEIWLSSLCWKVAIALTHMPAP
jgi:hypothetical protein